MARLRFLMLSLLMLVLLACENKNLNPTPSYPVYLDLNIMAEYPHFVPDNGYQTMTFTQRRYEVDAIGFAGVLVITAMDGQYHACDLCCPICLRRDSGVVVDGIFATCPFCGEQYDLSYGYATPMRGISRFPLRDFRCSYSGGHLIIRN